MLRARLLAALVLIPAFIAALFSLPDFAWAALVGLITIGATWEWARLARLSAGGCAVFAIMVGGAMVGLYLMVVGRDLGLLWGIALVLWCAAIPLSLKRWLRWRGRGRLLAAGATVLLLTWLAFVELRSATPLLVLYLMGLVWIADSAAYFAGHYWGHRKLAPSISPGKTWEGVIGAMGAGWLFTASWLLVAPSPLAPVADLSGAWLLLGAPLLVGVSIVGDLFESAVKRGAGVKDSGEVIPGHGGILDRIDSQTSAFPVAMALVYAAQRWPHG